MQRGTGNGWARAVRVVAGFVVGILAASIVASPAASGQSRADPSVAPEGLFTDLVTIDRQMANLISGVRTNGWTGAPDAQLVGQIKAEKLSMVNEYFDQPVYGLTVSQVVLSIDAVDASLNYALGLAANIGTHVFSSSEDEVIVTWLEKAKTAKQHLEALLHEQSGVPEGLLTDLVMLDRKFARLIDGVRSNGWTGAADAQLVGEIKAEKLSMVNEYFDQPVYGLTVSQVVLSIDAVDASLNYALGLAANIGTHVFSSSEDEVIVTWLEKAKTAKQQLEEDLHAAASAPAPTPSTTPTEPESCIAPAHGTCEFVPHASGVWLTSASKSESAGTLEVEDTKTHALHSFDAVGTVGPVPVTPGDPTELVNDSTGPATMAEVKTHTGPISPTSTPTPTSGSLSVRCPTSVPHGQSIQITITTATAGASVKVTWTMPNGQTVVHTAIPDSTTSTTQHDAISDYLSGTVSVVVSADGQTASCPTISYT